VHSRRVTTEDVRKTNVVIKMSGCGRMRLRFHRPSPPSFPINFTCIIPILIILLIIIIIFSISFEQYGQQSHGNSKIVKTAKRYSKGK
jgi:hypothetical protein